MILGIWAIKIGNPDIAVILKLSPLYYGFDYGEKVVLFL